MFFFTLRVKKNIQEEKSVGCVSPKDDKTSGDKMISAKLTLNLTNARFTMPSCHLVTGQRGCE